MNADNRLIVRNCNENTYEKLLQEEKNDFAYEIIESKKGAATLLLASESGQIAYHSKYDPEKEATTFISQFDIQNKKHILFIGTGLGYHIEQILNQNPTTTFSIYEPNIQVLHAFLKQMKLKKFKGRLVQIFNSMDDLENIETLQDAILEDSETIIWTVTQKLYAEEITSFQKKIIENLKSERSTIAVNASFQERWLTNSLMNFSTVLQTSNILQGEISEKFNNKPVIIVAAGPSLSEEIETLRAISEEKSAYIFSIGSAINTLINEDILPDAVLSYDPQSINYKVIEIVNQKNIDTIPLIFGSTVGFETVDFYKGPLVHMITSQDSFAHAVLKDELKDIVNDAPTIAVVTLQILLKLKAAPIILVGQNLGYKNNKRYAGGINHDHVMNELTEHEKSSLYEVESTTGGTVMTDDGFDYMRSSMENTIAAYPSAKVINTTVDGAKIMGTVFMRLKDVKDEWLTEVNIVENGWYKNVNAYDLELVYEKVDYQIYEFSKMFKYVLESKCIGDKIYQDHEKGIYKKLNSHLMEFDKVFNNLEKTNWYSAVLSPMIRVQYEKYKKNQHLLRFEKRPKQKSQHFMDITYNYLESVYAMAMLLKPRYDEFEKRISRLRESENNNE